MPKMLIVNANSFFIGGIERYIHQVASLLKKEGWTLYGLFENKSDKNDGFLDPFETVYYDEPKKRNNLSNMLAEVGVKVAFTHKITNPNLLQSLQNHFKVISVIHDHDYYCMRKHKYFPFRRINCKGPYRPISCTLCSLMIERKLGGVIPFRPIGASHKRKLLKLIRQADASIVLSDYMKNNLIMNHWNPQKIFKIYPIQKLYDPPMLKKNSEIKLLFVGQLLRGKGVDLLLTALKHIKKPYQADIVGVGNDEIFIRRLIIKYGLHDKVNLIGWAKDVTPFYHNADIIIVPSRWQEPFGLIGPESFANGKPVVGFDVGGISEWLKDGVNGYLIPPHNTRIMAERIERLMTNFNDMLKFGENGYKMVAEEYTTQRFMTQFNNLLQAIGAAE